MNGSTLSVIKSQFAQLSNNTNRHERTITTSATVVDHVLKHYAADAVIVKADEEILNFNEGSLTP